MQGQQLSNAINHKSASSARSRDTFPLNLLDSHECKPHDWSCQSWKVLRGFVNAAIGALNWCYGCKFSCLHSSRRTAAQRDVLQRLVCRCVDFHNRLQAPAAGSWESLTPDWVMLPCRPEGPKYGGLLAEKVDVLPQAGACDPMPCLPLAVQQLISCEQRMFADAPQGLDLFEDVADPERVEYIKLVVKQLRAKQLGLTTKPCGGGTVIAVGKPGGKRQRVVWHGRRVSAAAARPPKPQHLASPTALTFLECKFRCSKRDASCWFDQLALPAGLRRWMGRPKISQQELCSIGGMTVEEVQACLLPGELLDASRVCPVSLTWPMGFAWSSYIAQEFLLDVCRAADLDESRILSCEMATPMSFELAFAAATDDVMIFSDAGEGGTLQAAHNLDAEMQKRGIIRNTAKDVNDELCATCVGVALEHGTRLGVPPARCLAMIVSVMHLLSCAQASPKQVQQQLGAQQWFDLLRRCKLSVYNKVYDFIGDPHDTSPRRLPHVVLFELGVGVLLGIFWQVDLRKPFLPLLSATDASTEFGFGGSVARLPADMIRRLARISEKQGDYVVLDGGTTTKPAKRLGQAHQLGLSLDDFVDIFSVKSRHPAHINVLEGDAFLLWLCWILRCRRRHCSRVVVLVDGSVWLGAAAKGRSSTQLNRPLRKAAALEMAGELQVCLILVPSAENASDRPSRGIRCSTKFTAKLRSNRSVVPCNSPK